MPKAGICPRSLKMSDPGPGIGARIAHPFTVPAQNGDLAVGQIVHQIWQPRLDIVERAVTGHETGEVDPGFGPAIGLRHDDVAIEREEGTQPPTAKDAVVEATPVAPVRGHWPMME